MASPRFAKPLADYAEQVWQRLDDDVRSRWSTAEQAVIQQLIAVSPFIERCIDAQQEQALQFDAKQQVKVVPVAEYPNLIRDALQQCDDEQQAQLQLRRIRQRLMCSLAAADILGQLTLAEMLEHLSCLADSFIETTLNWLEARYRERHGTPVDEAGEAQSLLTIAMGKLGGCELNFSSDIDLIFCYPEQGETTGAKKSIDNSVFFTKLAQALVACLDTQTADGQVFRIDLRLRPFGQSGPLVASFAALEHYYQEQGRDWERYAMVKARLIGAVDDQSQALEAMLRPFVYRRYIDFSVIDALRKMKALIRQESARRGMHNNIKLGPGGIREIEFITQSFQLIRGGQERRLQTRSLYAALEMIESLGLLEQETVASLLQSYNYLRKVEHGLQQIDDEQTQRLPADELNQQRLAWICGYESWAACETEIKTRMEAVHHIFRAIIGDEALHEDESHSELQLLWQDLINDEDAIELLTDYCEADAEAIWLMVKQLRADFRRRGSGPRGRKAIAKLLPVLLEQILAQPQPKIMVERILQVLQRIASRTAYLELLLENPGAREQLLKLCRASAWMTEQIAQFPLLLDELIDPQHLYQLPSLTEYPKLLSEYLLRIPEQDLETQMDVLRQARQSLQLKIAAADISGALPLMKVSDHLSYLAEAVLAHVVQLAWQQLASKHGTPPNRSIENTGFAVLAYGKLGGLELGYGSDLDLVFVSDADYSDTTDGIKPIEVQQFYLRLAQRILHLFTTRTLIGILYDIDMRLRPSGKSGLLVSRCDTFNSYLEDAAWTWEKQALVRARPVYGPPELRAKLEGIRRSILMTPRDTDELKQDVLAMRQKMRSAAQPAPAGAFDLKQGYGGITDIEFMVQYLVLAYSSEYPGLGDFTDNIRILEQAGELELIKVELAEELIAAYQTLRQLQHELALDNQSSYVRTDISAVCSQVTSAWATIFQL